MATHNWKATYQELQSLVDIPILDRRRLKLKLGHLLKIVCILCLFPQGVIECREQTPSLSITPSAPSLTLTLSLSLSLSFRPLHVPTHTYILLYQLLLHIGIPCHRNLSMHPSSIFSNQSYIVHDREFWPQTSTTHTYMVIVWVWAFVFVVLLSSHCYCFGHCFCIDWVLLVIHIMSIIVFGFTFILPLSVHKKSIVTLMHRDVWTALFYVVKVVNIARAWWVVCVCVCVCDPFIWALGEHIELNLSLSILIWYSYMKIMMYLYTDSEEVGMHHYDVTDTPTTRKATVPVMSHLNKWWITPRLLERYFCC